jgi:chromosome partitioning protein
MVPVDNEEGNVAARSRALFEQLRSLRSKAPADGPAPVETTLGAAPEIPAEGSQSGDATPSDDGQNGGVGDGVPSPSDDLADADVSASGSGRTLEAGPVAGLAVVEDEAAAVASERPEDNGAAPAPVEDRGGRHPAADLPLPRVIAIANQKGGVGKTTTAVNLGAALAELGYRTLIIDLDPQGNATTGLGVNARNLEHAIYDVLMHELPLDECVEPTSVRNLFVAPATIDLAGAEIELVPAFSRELRLRRAIADMGDDYEFTIIDCPPSLGLLTVNGLAAATEVIVPIQCEYYALEGLSQLLRNVNLVQSNLNPPLIVSAIILTMYDARTKLADQVAGEVRLHFGAKVCRNVVPRTVRLSEAPSFGQPIIVFDSSSRGALAYRELAKEVSGGAPQRVG